MSCKSQNRRKAFSLIELVVVVVIIGIIAAIAIPKMSKGAQGAADSAVTGDLALLRQAIDMYANEHGGALPDPGEDRDAAHAILQFRRQQDQRDQGHGRQSVRVRPVHSRDPGDACRCRKHEERLDHRPEHRHPGPGLVLRQHDGRRSP